MGLTAEIRYGADKDMKHKSIQPFFSAILSLFMLIGSLLPHSVMGQKDSHLHIENVYTDKSVFNPTQGEKIELHFYLSKPAMVTATVYDSLNRAISTPLFNVMLQKGNHQLKWDGLNGSGSPLPQNYYLYTLEAKTADGEEVLYDPSDITGGKQIGIQNIKYNRNSSEISFTLKQAAIINMRVGMTGGGPMMNTLIDWMPFSPGPHIINWDGRDRSGNVSLENVKKLDINGPAYALPMNGLILTGNQALRRPVFLADTDVLDSVRAITIDPNRRLMSNHWRHRRNQCYDPEIILSLPANQKYNQDGIALVDGPLKLTMNVNESDRNFMINQRFEVVNYVDFLFAHEEEMGFLPYYWIWDPKGVNDGVHYITVMFRGYEGHFGTTTIKVMVRKQNNAQ